jgi:hypothetical protein
LLPWHDDGLDSLKKQRTGKNAMYCTVFVVKMPTGGLGSYSSEPAMLCAAQRCPMHERNIPDRDTKSKKASS